jgi:hypothetical protein
MDLYQLVVQLVHPIGGGGGCTVLGGVAAVAMVWPPSRLVEGATPLACARVALWPTVRTLSTLSVGLLHSGL